MLLSQSLFKMIKLDFLLTFFCTNCLIPNFSMEWNFTFMTIISRVEQFSHPFPSRVLLLLRSCQSSLRCPRTRVPEQSWQVSGGMWGLEPIPLLPVCTNPLLLQDSISFQDSGSRSCLWITTGISSCELWLLTHSLSPFLYSCLCCRLHLVAALVTDPPKPGLHFG